MSEIKERFYKLLKEVRIDFPEIKGVIWLIPVSKKDYYMATFWFIIYFDRKLNKLSDCIIKGLFAHELAHMLSRKNTERDCDSIALERGYFENLLAFHQWHNKKYKKYKKEEGFTLNEILKSKNKRQKNSN